MTISVKIESVCSTFKPVLKIFKNTKSNELIKMESVVLSGTRKDRIPVVGLGTWQATSQEIEDAVTNALKSGYRHIGQFKDIHPKLNAL